MINMGVHRSHEIILLWALRPRVFGVADLCTEDVLNDLACLFDFGHCQRKVNSLAAAPSDHDASGPQHHGVLGKICS